MLLLVGSDRETPTPASAPVLQDFAPTFGAVSLAEPVGPQPAHVVGLKSAFHGGLERAGSQPRSSGQVKSKHPELGGAQREGELHGSRARDTRCPVMRDRIRLVSSAGTGFTYYTTKNKRTQTNKLELKKYDPVVRQHVIFKEQKMPPHSK